MRFEGKNILIVSPEPWDHIFVSKHHYAVHLSKRNNQVFFLNPPTKNSAVSKTDFQNLVTLNYRGFPKGLRFFPSFLQKYFIGKAFSQLQKLARCKFDIVWSFDNSVFFDFNALPGRLIKISHIVDLNQDFQSESTARTATLCLCTTDAIKSRVIEYNPQTFKINHGFSVRNTITPVKLPGQGPIKVVYAGNLAMPFIDWHLIHRIVSQNKNVDFIFIGPGEHFVSNIDEQSKSEKLAVCKNENVFLTGKVESADLMNYLTAADILLIAYREKYHEHQANPHKMMEYLGSGKVVVATRTTEYQHLKNLNLIAMSDSNNDLPNLMDAVINNLYEWNAVDRQQSRKQIAQSNSYDNHISEVEKLLTNLQL
jgi:hypothetical protein